jgi:hypothetical protein
MGSSHGIVEVKIQVKLVLDLIKVNDAEINRLTYDSSMGYSHAHIYIYVFFLKNVIQS